MKYIPKKIKFNKQQKGKSFNKIIKSKYLNSLSFGSYGLKCISPGRLTSKQIESIYNCLNKLIKKNGRVVMRVFAHVPISKKPIEVRMGKGKGNIAYWAAKISAGSILCEIESNSDISAIKALIYVQKKISLRTKIISNTV